MGQEAYDAADVAAELRRRMPGIGQKKLHKLLYFCQGRHLADVGKPLFSESIGAWEMGPVVGGLWKLEQQDGPVTEGRLLDQGALNTIGFVLSRYGRLTGRDLEILTHHQPPWNKARTRGGAAGDRSPKIAASDLAEFFSSSDDLDDESQAQAVAEELREFLRGVADRLAIAARPDNLSRLQDRLRGLSQAGR